MPEKRDLSREQKLDELTRLIVGSPLVPETEKSAFTRNREFIKDHELDHLLGVFRELNRQLITTMTDIVRENPDALDELKKEKKAVEKEFRKARAGEEKDAEEVLTSLNTDENE